MKGFTAVLALALLAVGVMFLVVGYASPETQIPSPTSNGTQPTTPTSPTSPTSPETPVQPLPENQPPPPNDQAPPSTPPTTPTTPTTPISPPTSPTTTYDKKYFYRGPLSSGRSATATIAYPVNHEHRIVVWITAFNQLTVIPGGGSNPQPPQPAYIEVYINGTYKTTFQPPIPGTESYVSEAFYTAGTTTVLVKSLGGSSQCTVTIYCSLWPSTYSGFSVIPGVPDMGFLGFVMIGAAVLLMLIFRK